MSSGRICRDTRIKLLELRDLSITTTLYNLKIIHSADQAAVSEHDRLMLAIAFLAAAENCISSERSAHTSYLLSQQRVFKNHRAALKDLRKVIFEVHRNDWEVKALTKWQYWKATLSIGVVTCVG